MMHALCLQGSLNRYWFYHTHDLLGEDGVDASSNKPKATLQSEHKIRPIATIHRSSRRKTRIYDGKAATATAEGELPDSSGDLLGRTSARRGGRIIARQRRLISLEFRPVDVILRGVHGSALPNH